jgi:hemoglobin
MDRRTVAKSAGAIAGAAALGLFRASAEASGAPQTSATELSLYDRLGGYFGIALVVNRFSDEIITNPILKKNPALKEWNKTEAEARLPGLKFGRTLWIAAAAEEFAEVGAEIVRALDFYDVPEREQQELVAAYRASMSDVVTE